MNSTDKSLMVRRFFEFTTTRVFIFGLGVLFGLQVQASGITFHGKIMRPDGVTPLNVITYFRVQVLSPNSCLMWEEWFTRDLTNTQGVFTITLNNASGRTQSNNVVNPNTSANFSINEVFSNRRNFAALNDCSPAGGYSPNTGDGRVLRAFFRENPVDPWEQMPDVVVNYVPFAFDTLALEGYRASEFLKVDAASSYTPLTPTQVNTLMAIITGTASPYVKTTDTFSGDVSGAYNATSVDRIKGVPVSSTAPTTNQVLKYNGTSWAPAADDSGGAASDASYAAKGVVQINTDQTVSGLYIASGVLALPNTITAGGPTGGVSTIPVITYDQKGRLTAVTTATVNDTTKVAITDYNADLLPAASCTDTQTPYWNSVGSAWACQNIDFSGMTSSQWVTTGNDIYYNTGNVGIGTATPTSSLHVSKSLTPSATTSGSQFDFSYAPSAGITGNLRGLVVNTTASALNFNNLSEDLTGISAVTKKLSSGTFNSVRGGYFEADGFSGSTTNTIGSYSYAHSGNSTNLYGAYNLAEKSSSGSTTTLVGTYSKATNVFGGAAPAAVYGVYGNATNANTGSNNLMAYGGYFDVLATSGTNTTGYGLYIGNVQAGTKYSLYASDATAPSYFAGQIQIAGGSPGLGKVLTSDAAGLATWETPAGGGSGTVASGTTGRIAKYTGATTVGDSIITESSAKIGISNASPAGKLDISNTMSGGVSASGLVATSTITGSTAYSNAVSNVSSTVVHTGTAAINNEVVGVQSTLGRLGSGNSTEAHGFKAVVQNFGAMMTGFNSSLTVNNDAETNQVIGTRNYSDVLGSATNVSGSYGTQNTVRATLSATATNLYGTSNQVEGTAGASITNSYGSYNTVLNVSGGATMTNSYGVYVGTVQGTNKYSFYAADATAPSYFAGQVQIGGGSPGTGKVLTSNASGLATWETPSWVTTTDYNADLLPAASCTDTQTPYWNSVGSAWACQNINFSGITSSQWTTSGNHIYYNVADGNVGVGTATPSSKFEVVQDETVAASVKGIYSNIRHRVAGSGTAVHGTMNYRGNAASAGPYIGGDFSATTSASAGNTVTDMYGSRSVASHVFLGSPVTNLVGAYNRASLIGTGPTATNVIGTSSIIESSSPGTITDARGGYFEVNNANTLTIGNAYGVYIGGVKGTAKYSVYASDATAPSYFAGDVRSNTTFQGPVGSTSAPTFSNTTSVNTGMYFPSGNTISFSIAGTAMALLNSTGLTISGILTANSVVITGNNAVENAACTTAGELKRDAAGDLYICK